MTNVQTSISQNRFVALHSLTHWGRVTHICVGKLTIIGSDNGLSPEQRQAIIWTNAGILLIGPLETNFSEILIEIQTFSLKKIRLKISSAKCCSFRLGLNVLIKQTLWYFWTPVTHQFHLVIFGVIITMTNCNFESKIWIKWVQNLIDDLFRFRCTFMPAPSARSCLKGGKSTVLEASAHWYKTIMSPSIYICLEN